MRHVAALTSARGTARVVLDLTREAPRPVRVAYGAAHVLAALLPVATAWLTKVVLDRIVEGAGTGGMVTAAAALAGTSFAAATLPPVLRYLQAELERSLATEAKRRLYEAVGRIPMLTTLEDPAFRDRLRLAEQASRTGPSQGITSALAAGQSIITATGMLVGVTLIAPQVAAVLLVAAVPALFAELRLSRRRAQLLAGIAPGERRELFYTELLTSLSAAKETRLFGAHSFFGRRMLEELAAINGQRRSMDRRDAGVQSLLAALSAVLVGGALVWVLVGAANGRVSVGGAGAVLVAVGALQAALTTTVDHIAAGHYAALLVGSYRDVIASGRDTLETIVAPVARTNPVRGIQLVDVWFRYSETGPWVLRGVDLTLPEGDAVALVGENGSGKSTLIKLLCRFYEPTRGSILWDGVDIRELEVTELRSRIGAVFQDFMSYDLTAAENVAIGDVDGRRDLDLAPARIVAAARKVGVHDAFVTLPNGYQTLLSRTFTDCAGDDDGGTLLSGGQWQRVALARALLRADRELLLLDEPSSGLDARGEDAVLREIAANRQGRTSVLVSHRLNCMRDVDNIVVLASGSVVEQGTHDELLAANGTYAGLFRLQASGYQPATTGR